LTTARFYIPSDALQAGRVSLEGEDHHHASRVLRMKSGEIVVLLDGKGTVGHGTVLAIDSTHTMIEIESTRKESEPRPLLHLFQGLPHGTKMDDVVHWGVELGAASLVPFLSSRTGSVDAPLERRVRRWSRIALEASRVAGRAYLPEVTEVKTWQEAVDHLRGMDTVVFADEAGGERPAKALSEPRPDQLGLVVGPEGGFTDAERESLAQVGAIAVTLGDTVLRTETAGMVLLAAVRCYYGLL